MNESPNKLTVIGVLQPIADVDWHGKWRIQKAIEQTQELMHENERLRQMLIAKGIMTEFKEGNGGGGGYPYKPMEKKFEDGIFNNRFDPKTGIQAFVDDQSPKTTG